MVSVLLYEEPWAHSEGDDETIECEMDPSETGGYGGLIYPLGLTKNQKKDLLSMVAKGEIKPGEARLQIGASGATFDGKTIQFKENDHIPDFVTRGGPNLSTGRQLALNDPYRHIGVKSVLFVRVTDSVGKVYGHNAELMSSNVFGSTTNYADSVNLKSQLSACSYGQLTMNPASDLGSNQAPGAPGVTEVTINIPLEGNDRATIRNAITTAVQNKLGHTIPSDSTKGKYYDFVMYSVEGCYVDCGWAAYAYVNSWNSVFQGSYYSMTGVQVHEFGHNFGLAHSGGLDGATYTDHTGMMVSIFGLFDLSSNGLLDLTISNTFICLRPSFFRVIPSIPMKSEKCVTIPPRTTNSIGMAGFRTQ
jgi:hypothetical protein